MGIGDGTRVVCYDRQNVYSASRAWWMLRVMGHEDVVVLNGGLNKWRAEKRPRVDGAAPHRSEKHFTPRCNSGLVRDLNDMKRIQAAGVKQIVDARTAGRFAGTDPEPREVARLGRIPGSICLPYQKLLRPNGTLKAPEELRAVFAVGCVDITMAVVATWGSGVTACVIALALACLGQEQCPVYDGSWVEWAAADVPVEAG
jgi:thiosulfate/3-mercaptopyruvate sulfurtransferase